MRPAISLTTVKGRAMRRAREGGAVMFIIAMTLALLAGMGAYALTVAAGEVRTSGYLRQAVQTHYLSEWAVLGSTEELGVNGQFQLNQTLNPALALPSMVGKCPSIAAVPPLGTGTPPTTKQVVACRVLTPLQLVSAPTASNWSPLNTTPAPNNQPIEPYTGPATPGDLGLPTTPSFNVELTNPFNLGPAPGTDIALKLCLAMMTVTSMGLTPTTAGAIGSEGLEQARARIAFGPVPCSGF